MQGRGQIGLLRSFGKELQNHRLAFVAAGLVDPTPGSAAGKRVVPSLLLFFTVVRVHRLGH